jgi:5-methyltetrahydropteroyltriglutamate--homocysteine methyltransferase
MTGQSMQRTKPPFRADQVGSLLRSAPVKAARTRRLAGDITAAALKAIEDGEIRKLVAKQESIGLQAVTDGEFRRAWWHYDFLSHLDGVELVRVAQGLQFKGTQTKAEGLHVHGKIDFSAAHPMLEHFRYLKSVARAVPKMTIPSPTALHYRGGRQAIEKSAYPEMEPFFADLGAAYGKAVRAFGESGCTYLQLDEVFVAYLCDGAQREYLRGRGDDPDKLLHVYADLANAACAGKTPGMTISMHLCRGNFRSTWMAQAASSRCAFSPETSTSCLV